MVLHSFPKYWKIDRCVGAPPLNQYYPVDLRSSRFACCHRGALFHADVFFFFFWCNLISFIGSKLD